VILLVLLALTARVLPVEDQTARNVLARRLPPGAPGHPLGTDTFGFIALVVAAIGGFLGIFLGVVVGYPGGFLDSLVGQIQDALLSLPRALLFPVILARWGPA